MADTLKPGEFLVTREQVARAPWDNAVLEAVATDPDAFTRALDLGPATSADLLELDAVPEPVDSDAPSDIHARTLARART